MPTVSVSLDEELHAWLCQRARDHDSSPAAELAALAAEARERQRADDPPTELPVGVYEADDGTTVVELGDPETDKSELPVGVYHDPETNADGSETNADDSETNADDSDA